MRALPALIAAVLATAAVTGTGIAQVQVIGQGMAATCSNYAFAGDKTRAALRTCSLALDTEAMGRDTTAATYVNRGIIHMRLAMYANAARDYDRAEGLAPELAEIYLNRGAMLIRQGEFAQALAETNQGLALNPRAPEKGYFNRALAYEGLENYEAAYLDFRRAMELKPEWDLPIRELARYTVTPAAS